MQTQPPSFISLTTFFEKVAVEIFAHSQKPTDIQVFHNSGGQARFLMLMDYWFLYNTELPIKRQESVSQNTYSKCAVYKPD